MSAFVDSFIKRFCLYISNENLFDKNAKIIVAVSGGIDSISLLDVLLQLKSDLNAKIAVAHINHKLRGGESDDDARFVETLCNSWDIPFYSESFDLSQISESGQRSLQEVAREKRYEYLERLRNSLNFDLIATGHTANDNAETVLFHTLRGSGPEGLAGIPPKRDRIIRPLLFATREDIQQYAESRGLKFRIDSSNQKNVYTRNIIRNKIIPVIESSLEKNIIIPLNQTAQINRLVVDFLKKEVDKIASEIAEVINPDYIKLPLDRVEALHPLLANYLVRHVAKTKAEINLSFEQTNAVIELLHSQAGSSILLSEGWLVERESTAIGFVRETEKRKSFRTLLAVGEELEADSFLFRSSYESIENVVLNNDKSIEYVDAQKVGTQLILRNWESGDWFIPLGMKERKKISDFFIDEKIPKSQRNKIPVLESNGEIVWVCGLRIDERVKITPKTKQSLKLEYYQFQKN